MLTWDRTLDWVLYRTHYNVAEVTIRFRLTKPSADELAVLRRCLPGLRDVAPASVRAMIGERGHYSPGVMPTPDARMLIEVAEAHGLRADAVNASYVGYVPVDRVSGLAWFIENEAQSMAVIREMLAAGITVQEVEA